MHTEEFGSSVVEIGANWIHGGCVANPVFNLANRRRKSLLLHDGKVNCNYCSSTVEAQVVKLIRLKLLQGDTAGFKPGLD